MAVNFMDWFWNLEPAKIWQHPTKARRRTMMDEVDLSDYFGMVKYDGEWRMMIHDLQGNVRIKTRSVSKVTGTYGDHTDKFPHLVQEMKEQYPKGTVLIGEVCYRYKPESTSKEVASVGRALVPKALQYQKDNGWLDFVVFDVLAFDGKALLNKPFIERYTPETAQGINIKPLDGHHRRYIKAADNFNGEDAKERLEEILAEGREGIILIKKDAPYRPGKRTAWESMKVKKSLPEFDVKVLSTLEPKKDYNGTELEDWSYWVVQEKVENGMITEWVDVEKHRERVTYRCINRRTIPVTKPYYFDWKNGIRVEVNGKVVDVTSGLTDIDREWLASDEAQAKIAAEELEAVISGMFFTVDSIRHPYVVNLRSDK